MDIDDHGAELLIAAIIERAIYDHATAAKRIKNSEKTLRDYQRWRPMFSWVIKYRNSKKRNRTVIADKVSRKTMTAYRRYMIMRDSYMIMEEVENFFKSEYFKGISMLDGDKIVENMQEREGLERRRRRNERSM